MTVLERLADLVDGLHEGRRALVAVDGPDAAGKTTLAARLAAQVRRPVVPVSVDHWHRPRADRTRRGALSPEGCYLDSFATGALVHECLAPFAAGAARVRTRAFDHVTDRPVEAHADAAPDAVLLCEGVFLLRPELVAHWDLRVHLHVPEEVTLARAVLRDVPVLGDAEAVRARYRQRYLPAQELYRRDAAPREVADVVLDTRDLDDPAVLRWPHG